MAIRAMDVIHRGRGSFLVSRLQNAGPGGLNIPVEMVKELGNYKTVAAVRDVPDLSYTMNSYDVTTQIERMLTNNGSIGSGGLDMALARGMDLVGLIKPGALTATPFEIVKSVACPAVFPEKISYKYQVGQNSTLDVSLRGDSIYYCPGTAYVQTATGSGVASQTITLSHAAGVYTNVSGDTRILALEVDGQRLIEEVDFTSVATVPSDDFTAVTVTIVAAVPVTSSISLVYFSNVAENDPQSIHPLVADVPAAVKGRDVRVYVGATYDPANPAASAAYRWGGVQSASLDWGVTVTKDYELGTPTATLTEAEDVPTVGGTITVRAKNATELFARLRQISGVTNEHKAVGPDNAVELTLDIVVLDNAGNVHKRHHVADARFSLPGYSAQVGQRVDSDLIYTSDTGSLLTFEA